jgi:hypothetical protein
MENELLSSTGNTPASAFARFLPYQGDFLIFFAPQRNGAAIALFA